VWAVARAHAGSHSVDLHRVRARGLLLLQVVGPHPHGLQEVHGDEVVAFLLPELLVMVRTYVAGGGHRTPWHRPVAGDEVVVVDVVLVRASEESLVQRCTLCVVLFLL
jgi:hypothetical protein